MIYYGDEVGMWGASDPNNRKPMLWQDLQPYQNAQDAVNTDLLAYYKGIIAMRRANSALLEQNCPGAGGRRAGRVGLPAPGRHAAGAGGAERQQQARHH
ncbi:MAG: hypothetical protein U0636_08355 [Phycisphaerales bacterium]